jgi:hypothetical protein
MKHILVLFCCVAHLSVFGNGSITKNNQEKQFAISEKYLILPIQNVGKMEKLTLYVDGELIFENSLVLATSADSVDWYAFYAIEGFKGKLARIVYTGDAG